MKKCFHNNSKEVKPLTGGGHINCFKGYWFIFLLIMDITESHKLDHTAASYSPSVNLNDLMNFKPHTMFGLSFNGFFWL